jgi:hypothetical protein
MLLDEIDFVIGDPILRSELRGFVGGAVRTRCGHWPGWRESIPNYWDQCGTAARKHKSTNPRTRRTGERTDGFESKSV